jgi:flagellar basal body-associated protein FliL
MDNNNQKLEESGPLIGIIIIIIILLAGAWYFIGNRIEKIQNQKNATSSPETFDPITSSSTEIEDIQTDLII